MDLSPHLQQEFRLRIFEESMPRIRQCLDLLTEVEIWDAPLSNLNSSGNLILHLCGNAKQWILSGLGTEFDTRMRDLEFLPESKISKAELLLKLEILESEMETVLPTLSSDKLTQIYEIQGFKVTGMNVLIHVIEHFSYHTGQITFLTKLISGKETHYYDGIDLNK